MLPRRLVVAAVLFSFILISSPAVAEEGMWPLYDLDKLDFKKLKAQGLELSRKDIYNTRDGGLAGAIFDIGGGTGSFVSRDGLIVTNHHVAFGAIQRKSTVENNYIRDGFYAASREEEIPAIGYSLYATLSSEDVTDRVLGVVNDEMDDLARYKAIDAVRKAIIKECEDGRDVKCRVATMFGGTQYVLYTRFKVRDIRIVYAPPASIGQYGGDIDNWMWPRHTGDYSFMRAYVATDGSSADYAEENVPYHPDVYLPISTAGVKEGDFAMVIGFPGGTSRYASSYEIENLVKHRYPAAIEIIESMLGILDGAAARDSSVAIRVRGKSEGLNNAVKNFHGMLDGFEKADILGTKIATEKDLTAFLKKNRKPGKKYGHVLPEVEEVFDEIMKTEKKDFMIRLMRFGSDYLDMSATIYKWAVEREKEDMERERGYQDRDSTATREGLEHAQINLLPSVDRVTLRYFLELALGLPEDQEMKALEKIFGGREGSDRDDFMEKYLDRLYAVSKIGDLEGRMAMFKMSQAELEAMGDPFIDLAAALKPEDDERIERSKKFRGGIQRLEPQLIGAYREWKGGNLYPDANGTKRFNWGTVKGYSPSDAVYHDYITTLAGVMEKETGEDPFIVPPPLKVAWEKKDYGRYADRVKGDIPVDFLTTSDSTGGNSGSPLLNGRGEVIGLLFDGNYEAMTSDYLFNNVLTRAINVDIRYVLFTVDKVYGHKELMSELTIR
ncbi:MAG: S46 family peptidase [Candidatus Eisenbacteria sp.]|nr:S46 family peptidase [Candidatus Eisenbacteria bacterium]